MDIIELLKLLKQKLRDLRVINELITKKVDINAFRKHKIIFTNLCNEFGLELRDLT